MVTLNFKCLLFLFFILIFSSCFFKQKTEYNLELELYKDAFELLLDSKSTSEAFLNINKTTVSTELIRFRNYSDFFELTRNRGLTAHYPELLVLGSLSQLRKVKAGKSVHESHVFFSEIVENLFFAEIFETKKEFKYDDRPNFGVSEVYLFSTEPSVKIIDTLIFHYN